MLLFPLFFKQATKIIVARHILEAIAEDLQEELGQSLGVLETKILRQLTHPDIDHFLELLIFVSVVIYRDVWHLSMLQNKNQKVEQGDQVVSSTRCAKVKLIAARKFYVSFEHVYPVLLNMLLRAFIDEPGSVPKVYDLHFILLKDVFVGRLEMLDSGVIIKE